MSGETSVALGESLDSVTFRTAETMDGTRMHRLVADTGVLEQNTVYAYLLLATHFSKTCLIAERDGELLGFIAAYVPPQKPDAIFVWQIGVSPKAQGQGLGKRMLSELIALSACANVRHLEATVADSNESSQRLFNGWARDRNRGCSISKGFCPSDFGSQHHENENLYRIGPFTDGIPS